MAGDDFKKRQSGDPFVMKAPLYNALIDAARHTKQNRHDLAGNFQPDHRTSTIVPIRNSSGVDKSRGGVLGITGPIIGPSDNLDEFLSPSMPPAAASSSMKRPIRRRSASITWHSLVPVWLPSGNAV